MADLFSSQTFKTLLIYILTLVANAVSAKYGVSLNVEGIAGLTVAVVAFFAGRQWKSVQLEKIQSDAAKAAAANPAPTAADALAQAAK